LVYAGPGLIKAINRQFLSWFRACLDFQLL
jgi:hypothetical protein